MADVIYEIEKMKSKLPGSAEPSMEEMQNSITSILSSLPEDMKDRPVQVELVERSVWCDAKTMQVHVQPGRASINILPSNKRRIK